MSHSPDLASWRWTNCARCSSADVENSTSLTVTPLFWALNSLIASLMSPAVSLPMQTVTSPFAFSIDAGSTAFAPSVEPVSVAAGCCRRRRLRRRRRRRRSRPSARCSRATPRNAGSFSVPLLLLDRPSDRVSLVSTTPHLRPTNTGGAVLARSTTASGIRRLSTASPDSARSSMLGAQGADLLERLRDRGEPGESRGLHVVEADDRELLGHRDLRGLGRLEHADRLDVGASRRWQSAARRRRAARPPRRARRRGRAAGAGSSPAGAGRRRRRAPRRSPRAGGRSSRTRTGSPPRRRGRRCAVAEREQVLGGEPAAGDVVDRDRGEEACVAVDQHDGEAGRLEPAQLAVGRRERDRQQPVDAAADAERAEGLARAARGARRRSGSAGGAPRRARARCRGAARSPTAA